MIAFVGLLGDATAAACSSFSPLVNSFARSTVDRKPVVFPVARSQARGEPGWGPGKDAHGGPPDPVG